MKNGKALTVVALAAVCCHVAAAAETVKASSFGWNGKDDTEALQKALDSGAATVVVDRVSGSWVTRPLFARSNQTIIFERGCVLEAKKGEFLGKQDCLFTCEAVTNLVISGYGATWRMHRSDYAAPPYVKGEWRHSLQIKACANVTVEGLTLLESGGDGVYVGTNKQSPRERPVSTDITLRDLVCDRHYRQGISVITARRLLIERCVMKNTFGTPPAAGIDFEPNYFREELTDCVMRDCVSEYNQGCGIDMFFGKLTADTKPLSIVVERCVLRHNGRGISISTLNKNTYPSGLVKFSGCRILDEKGAGLLLTRKPASAFDVLLEKCEFSGCHSVASRPDNVSDIMMRSRNAEDPTSDGLELRECVIRTPVSRDWISRKPSSALGENVGAVRGTITVETPAGAEKLALDGKWCAEYFEKPVFSGMGEAEKFDPSLARPVDGCPGKSVKLAPLRVRMRAKYRFYAAEAGTVGFTGRTFQLNRRKVGEAKIAVRDASGKKIAEVARPGKKGGAIRVAVPSCGFYELDVPVGRAAAFVLESSEVPVALDISGRVNFIDSTGELGVSVAEGAKVRFGFSGDGSERIRATVLGPDGNALWDREGVSGWEAFSAERAKGGYWTLRINRSKNDPFEDSSVMVRGVQPVAFLCAEKRW